MGFCTFCGKQVAEGEVCSCQQSAPQSAFTAPQGNYAAPVNNAVKVAKVKGESLVSPIMDDVKAVIANPIEAGDKYFKTADRKKSIISVAALAIVYVLSSIFMLLADQLNVLSSLKKMIKSTGVYSAGKLSGLSYGDMLIELGMPRKTVLRSNGISGGTWVQSVFFPIVYMILMAVVVVGLFYLVNALFIKQKVQLDNILKLAGAVSVPIMVALVFNTITNFIHVRWLSNTLFRGVYTAIMAIALLQALHIIKGMIPDTKSFAFSVAIFVCGIIIFDYIIGTLFLGHFDSHFVKMPTLLGQFNYPYYGYVGSVSSSGLSGLGGLGGLGSLLDMMY